MSYMENECSFVCSRGILKSCDFHSPTPRSSCSNDVGYLLAMLDSGKMFDGMSIYVCSDLLNLFVGKFLPRLNHRFTLVSGDSDLVVPYEAITEDDTVTLLENPLLIRWFAQNAPSPTHNKLILLPIGLDYHTISGNPNHCWRVAGEPILPRGQEGLLNQIRASFGSRKMEIFVNFTAGNDRFGQRITALHQVPRELLALAPTFMPRTQLWNRMKEYAFVLSPFGMGMDCHRTWEALALGCIPIIQTRVLAPLFADLPVLMVENWSDITPQLLATTIADFQQRTFRYELMQLEHWVGLIRHV
jgi:hypothetical protein